MRNWLSARVCLRRRPVRAASNLLLALICAPQLMALPFTAALHSADAQENLSQEDRWLRRVAERRFLAQGRQRPVDRRVGDYLVPRSETVRGDLVVAVGQVTVAGEVRGSVLAVRGDVMLDSTGRVYGDVVAIDGRIDRLAGSVVEGDMVEMSAEAMQNGRSKWSDRQRGYDRRYDRSGWDDEREEPFVLRYNRVDGLFLGPRLPRRYRSGGFADLAMYGFGGYAFASKKWQHQLGAELHLHFLDRTTIGVEAHDFTATEDEWIIPEDENSLAAFFVREDFRDFYRGDGFGLYASQKLGAVKVITGYHDEHISSLPKETDWSLFGGDKKFRDNPAIDPGRLVTVTAGLNVDSRNHPRWPRQGWLIAAQSEFSRPDFHSDFDFDRFIIDIRRYQPLDWAQNLDLRLRVGSARGILPAHALYDLGGISTLRGYDFKAFTGDRMVLCNIEYRVNARHSRAQEVWFLEPFNLIFFVDSGLAWFASDPSAAHKSFDFLTPKRLRTSIGFAITDGDGRVRLNFAKRTDIGGQGLVITLRLNRDF